MNIWKRKSDLSKSKSNEHSPIHKICKDIKAKTFECSLIAEQIREQTIMKFNKLLNF